MHHFSGLVSQDVGLDVQAMTCSPTAGSVHSPQSAPKTAMRSKSIAAKCLTWVDDVLLLRHYSMKPMLSEGHE